MQKQTRAVSVMALTGVVATHVCSLPPDKGTIQKVIVLPSNRSLHEDLILEELEVFKVCLPIPAFSFIPFLSQNQRQGGGGGGAPLDTTQRPQADKDRVAFRRWMFCSTH